MDYSNETINHDYTSTPTYHADYFETFGQIRNEAIPIFDRMDGYYMREEIDEMGISKEMRSDVLYVVLNFTAWYVAMQDRMSDSELAMFTPVLDRMMKLVESINKGNENPD